MTKKERIHQIEYLSEVMTRKVVEIFNGISSGKVFDFDKVEKEFEKRIAKSGIANEDEGEAMASCCTHHIQYLFESASNGHKFSSSLIKKAFKQFLTPEERDHTTKRQNDIILEG
jgi:hypothetical protein